MTLESTRQRTIDKCMARGGMRGRIDAMCASCIYDPAYGSGTWRNQVKDCTSKDCPLYDIRPLPIPKKGDS